MYVSEKSLLAAALFCMAASVSHAGSITIEELCATAGTSNLELQKLDVENRQAVIDRKNAEATRLPSVDFQAAFTYMSSPIIEPVTFTAGELGVYEIAGSEILLPFEDMTIFGGTENTHYDFKLILDQPVYAWGKITNAIELYGRVEETSVMKIESKRKEIKTGITIYFYSLFYIAAIENSLHEQMIDAERLITLADEAYKNGFILYTELLTAKIQAKKLEIAAAELREQKEAALLSLSLLSGHKDLDLDSLDFSRMIGIEDIDLSDSEDYLAAALQYSPEIEMLNRLRDINELKADITKGASNFKPDIGLHFELGYSGPRLPFVEIDWFRKDSLNITATLGLQTNIFDGGKQNFSIERDLEELEKSYFEYELGIESLNHLITESILKLELNRRNIEYYRLLQENDTQQFELKQTQYIAGSGNENDMLGEKINFNIHKIDEYTESIEFFKNYFTLLSAASSYFM